MSLDVWYKNHPSSADYQQLRNIAGTKPMAIGEIGKMPTAAMLQSQPQWAWFMMWSEHLRGTTPTPRSKRRTSIPAF